MRRLARARPGPEIAAIPRALSRSMRSMFWSRGLAALIPLAALGCATAPTTAAPPPDPVTAPDAAATIPAAVAIEDGDALDPDDLAIGDEPAETTETIRFDDVDAADGPTGPIGGIAPRRKPIPSFELFGTGGRGGPG